MGGGGAADCYFGASDSSPAVAGPSWGITLVPAARLKFMCPPFWSSRRKCASVMDINNILSFFIMC